MRGRPSLVVGTEGFLRPASLRLEYGHQDVESYYNGWHDTGALWREVFDPSGQVATGAFCPTCGTRSPTAPPAAPPSASPPGGALLLHGPFLLRHWFPLDLSVHLVLRPRRLRRRTPEAEHWTLPAFERYADETDPSGTADVLVRADDPRHPRGTADAGACHGRP